MAFRRFQEWCADHFGAQYPKQEFIPRRSIQAEVTPEQRMVLRLVAAVIGLPALFLLGTAIFIAGVWIFGSVPH